MTPRRSLLIGAAGYAAALAAGIAVLGPGELVNIAGSPQALLRFGALGVGWFVVAYLVLPRVLRRGVRRTAVRGTLVTLALAGALASTLRTTTVDDAAPDLAAVAVDAPVPDAGRTPAVGASGAATATRAPAAPTAAPSPTVSATRRAAAVRLGVGDVAGINHKGAGRAALIRLADGSAVARFEDLDVDNAPDMRVWLVRGADREKTDGGIDLGRLKGNKGDQNYAVRAGTDLPSGEWTVLIWCRAFAVPIANATISVA